MDKSKLESKSKFLLFVEIFGDAITFLFKLIVGILTNSTAVIAEAFHSLADTTNQLFLLIGIETGKTPADKEHPFGYGKERFFWAFISALFIMIFCGGFSIYRGISRIIDTQQITNFKINFLILAIALIIQTIVSRFSFKYFKTLTGKISSLKELIVKVRNVKEPLALNLWFGDLAGIGGNFVAIICLSLVLLTGELVFDGIGSVIIGIILVGLGWFLAVDSKELLIGEAVSPAMYNQIARVIDSHPNVVKIIKLKTMYLTPTEVLITADLSFKAGLSTSQIEKTIDQIESSIRKQFPSATQIVIEAESLPEK